MGVIPKKIHYCWFGGGQKSEMMEKCMESWKKFFPDYEIIEWNETNFDVHQNAYISEAYESKKWAFVSDYARLVVIYQYGGIYFDTDVEVVRNFEHLLTDGGYLCFQNPSNNPDDKTVNTGVGFAAEAGDKTIEAMMHDYDQRHFIVNGEMNMTPCTDINTDLLVTMGLRRDGSLQKIGNLTIYPYEYFCGFDIANSHPKITDHTYTIHHYAATWTDPLSPCKKMKYKVIVPALQKILGFDGYDKLKKLLKG